MQITTIGLDLAKNVFQVHGIDAKGKVVFRRRLGRAEVHEFFAGLEPCLVGLELQRRQGAARPDIEAGKPVHLEAFGARRDQHVALRARQQGARSGLGQRSARAPADAAGYRRHGQQDGADRLGIAGQG